jgi:hypothetical protein
MRHAFLLLSCGILRQRLSRSMLHVMVAAEPEYDRTPPLQERAASLTGCSVLSAMQCLTDSLSPERQPSQPLHCRCPARGVNKTN